MREVSGNGEEGAQGRKGGIMTGKRGTYGRKVAEMRKNSG